MSFSRTAREPCRADDSAGPGHYDVDRAVSATKTKLTGGAFSKDEARPKSLAKNTGVDVAPGQYDDGVRFNSNSKAFKIGEKRPDKVSEGMGPGSYAPERADALTKHK